MELEELKNKVEAAWEDRSQLQNSSTVEAIEKVLELIDLGKLRTAQPAGEEWQINEWVKKAVVLYFPIRK
ncbi:MAG: 2,3,4,5-tetrahydropyridine-2,6-dicarboxylate N-succinyltransferase, partial [Flavobacteriales bacterium]|nr:2,3,4,5-tetrahydropyridine-2,6-dicarboxylate N-succinyltransferase [Flavobacteriales bacterium]